MSNKNTSEIKFLIELDENRVRKINVVCKDGGVEQEEAKAIMLSIWDSKVKRACALIYGRRICQLTK
jgi:hypothetical protein